MEAKQPIVYVVDDDRSVRRALQRLMKSVGLSVETFATAEDFLQHDYRDTSSCLILDIRMPEIDGLELQRRLIAAERKIPVIFITAHDDPAAHAHALKNGAIEVFQKPFDDRSLLGVVYKALDYHPSD